METIQRLWESDDKALRVELLEEISDRIAYKYYSIKDVFSMIEYINQLDILRVDYELREQLLYLLCEIVEHYDIENTIKIDNIIAIKMKVEPDLKEYIEEIINCITPPHRQA